MDTILIHCTDYKVLSAVVNQTSRNRLGFARFGYRGKILSMLLLSCRTQAKFNGLYHGSDYERHILLCCRQLNISDGKLIESQNGSGQVCVYITPDEAERKYLVDQLKIDEHTLSSSLDPDEVSRLEFEPEHIAMIFKRPKRYSAIDNFLFRVGSTGVFMFKDRLVIVLAEDAPIFRRQTIHEDSIHSGRLSPPHLPRYITFRRAPQGHQPDF